MMSFTHVHVFGSEYAYTSAAKALVNEGGKVLHDSVYRFLGEAKCSGQLREHLTSSGQVGVGTIRIAKEWAKSPQRREKRRSAKPKRQKPRRPSLRQRVFGHVPERVWFTSHPRHGLQAKVIIAAGTIVLKPDESSDIRPKDGEEWSVKPTALLHEKEGFALVLVKCVPSSTSSSELKKLESRNGNGHKKTCPAPASIATPLERFRRRHGGVEASLTQSGEPSGENILSSGEAKRDPSIDWEAASRQRKEAMHATPPSRGEAVAGTRRRSASSR